MKPIPSLLLTACTLPCLCSCNHDMENMQAVYLAAQASKAQQQEHHRMRMALFKERNFSLKPQANVYYDGEFYYVVDIFLGGTPRSAREIRRRGRKVAPQKYAEYLRWKRPANASKPPKP